MKHIKVMTSILIVLIMTMSMVTIASAEGITETYTINANNVTYSDDNCADGFGWRYGTYHDAGSDIFNRMAVNFPIDGLIAYKLAGASSYDIQIDFTWISGTGVYSSIYPTAVMCDKYDWQTWFSMWSDNGDVVGQKSAESGSVTSRYYTFPDVNISSTEVFENDIARLVNIQYEMLFQAYNIAERACMRSSITSAVMTITINFDSEQSAQLAVDNYTANIASKVEQNQQTIINQNNQIISPDSGDMDITENMQSNVSNRQEQSDQLVEDIKVDKPTITDELLNPVDEVDEESLNTMGGVLGAVFVSPTLGSIAVMTLVFGLIGYILYGKR